MVKKVFKISDEQIKQMYLEGNSLNDIAKVAQDTKGLMALRNRLHELGVSTSVSLSRYRYKLSKAFKRYKLDEHVFDNIDTEEKAYWLGFLMADGYNHETKTCVALRLQARDKEILEKYKLFLKTDVPIYTFTRVTSVNHLVKQYCEVNICSPWFSDSLAKLGCKQGKTESLTFPEKVPEKLYNHFIRGYFDGDGCISVKIRKDRRKRNGKSMRYQFTIVGKPNFLQKVQAIICKATKRRELPLKKCKSPIIECLHYTGRNRIVEAMNYLYKNATIYLKRKHDLYLQYCIPAE